jgi:hypothetical protein
VIHPRSPNFVNEKFIGQHEPETKKGMQIDLTVLFLIGSGRIRDIKS